MGDQARYSGDDRGRSVFRNTIAFIDAAPLTRECFARVVESEHPGIRVAVFESVEEWRLTGRETHFDAVTCSVGLGSPAAVSLGVALRDLVAQASPTPVVALADTDSVEVMTAAVNCGALGCIPTRIGVDALIHAVQLISSGCVALAATAFASAARDVTARDGSTREVPVRAPVATLAPPPAWDAAGEEAPLFTPRQRMVAEALRHGKANKVIARDLSICENTVKVHIQVIMKKLGVRNRTEAAFKLNNLFQI